MPYLTDLSNITSVKVFCFPYKPSKYCLHKIISRQVRVYIFAGLRNLGMYKNITLNFNTKWLYINIFL